MASNTNAKPEASAVTGGAVSTGSPTFKTPLKPRMTRQTPMAKTPLSAGKFSKIVIPPSPLLSRLGYGTGVSVYALERPPDSRGHALSPWALKKLNSIFRNRSSHQRKCLITEAAILRTLSHPNIVGFRGYVETEGRNPVLLMEKGDHSLMDLIEERNGSPPRIFEPRQILKVAQDVAAALNYLHHEKRIMHGDVKSANVLIHGDFKAAKLCDFGVPVRLNDALEACDPDEFIGTYYWTAKEALSEESRKVTNKSEIYSYGLVVWEMLTLRLPHVEDDDWDGESSDEEDEVENIDPSGDVEDDDMCDSSETADVGSRPPLPVELNHVYQSDPKYDDCIAVYFACTSEDPGERPSAEQLLHAFDVDSFGDLFGSDDQH